MLRHVKIITLSYHKSVKSIGVINHDFCMNYRPTFTINADQIAGHVELLIMRIYLQLTKELLKIDTMKKYFGLTLVCKASCIHP